MLLESSLLNSIEVIILVMWESDESQDDWVMFHIELEFVGVSWSSTLSDICFASLNLWQIKFSKKSAETCYFT